MCARVQARRTRTRGRRRSKVTRVQGQGSAVAFRLGRSVALARGLMLLDCQFRVGVKRPQGLIAHVIGEEPRSAVAAFAGGVLLGRRDRAQLDTRYRAVLGRVRVVQPVFLISQLSCAVQRVVLVVRRRHRPLQVVQRIRVVGGVVYAREIATRRAVTADRAAVAVPESVAFGYAARGTVQQQLLAAAAAFRKARLATGGLVRASCAGRVIEGGILLGVGGWWKCRVANVHRMQRRVACQPKVIASDKVN